MPPIAPPQSQNTDSAPQLSKVIEPLQSVKRRHGDIEFWIQIHHADRPLNYGERNLRIVVEPIPPTEHPPVCVLHMDA
jgi:hypothetical protein